ncbi:hypothetical protein PV327_003383 [Microctonus hyperodae]|uniref:C-type lectin domain-containing protein n=1 Tax=Microctonus hyperodae TaxID=165561 RepID=A0AA39G4U6_MICHY|nr:hypothetical protein PV327_003383 [Microctonus hyperodae]
MIDHSQPWGSLLVNWTILQDEKNNSRTSRVMKFNEKVVNIMRPGSMTNKREVSETDLYLLGAIEKLLYRVDTLERRVRRAEELLYYVISGNNTNKNQCPMEYTRIKKHCYHFSTREFDWKSSASLCRGLGGNLIELKSAEEKYAVEEYLLRDKLLRGKDFWTGGLNPGLLWIWASSAEQVYEDATETIAGNGRCLRFQYKMEKKSYFYYGEECIKKLRYICKLVQNESINTIEGTARAIFKSEYGN